MLGILVKKQLSEVFKSYFYNAKKNRMRSKWAIAGFFAFFIVVMVGFLGGIFTMLARNLCAPLTAAGLGWMYFLLMSGVAIFLGAFGSVFNTYAGLYLSKDNDLLLSMPIPVRTIIAARLVNVYLMGAMYALTALLPALIVYWIVAGATVARVVCGVMLVVIVTFIVLLLSTVLGWVVAKISVKLKNKSFISVLVSLLFIGAYYFFYFKANGIIQDIVLNAAVYGAKIKGAAHGLYVFGRIGEGDWAATAIVFAITAALCALVWFELTRSFLSIATASGKSSKARYTDKTARQRSVFGAMLFKELGRFTASPNYMLNCGLSVLILIASGVLLLFKGGEVYSALGKVFTEMPGAVPVLLCAALCLVSAMNDMAAPSVSLEGKSLWIPQSMPVEPKTVLRAKASMQLILTGLPMLFASVCAVAVLEAPLPMKLLVCATALAYTAFAAAFGTTIGLKMPLLNWTNETAPIKESGAVMIALFGGWAVCVAFGGLYLLIGYRLGATAYLGIWLMVFVGLTLIFTRWLDTRGAKAFAEL